MRSDYMKFSEKPISHDEFDAFRDAPVAVLATIMTGCIQKVIETTTPDVAFFEFLVRSLVLTTTTPRYLGINMIKGHLDIAKHLQATLVSGVMDKVWRHMSAKELNDIGVAMKTVMTYIPVDISKMKIDDFASPSTHGWHVQQLVDLSALYVATQALGHRENVLRLDRDKRKLIGSYADHQSKLSSRCRTHFKSLSGSQKICGKHAWETIVSFSSEFNNTEAKRQLALTDAAPIIPSVIEEVKAATLAADWEDSYNVMCSLEHEKARAFGVMFAHIKRLGEDADVLENISRAETLGTLVLHAVETVMTPANITLLQDSTNTIVDGKAPATTVEVPGASQASAADIDGEALLDWMRESVETASVLVPSDVAGFLDTVKWRVGITQEMIALSRQTSGDFAQWVKTWALVWATLHIDTQNSSVENVSAPRLSSLMLSWGKRQEACFLQNFKGLVMAVYESGDEKKLKICRAVLDSVAVPTQIDDVVSAGNALSVFKYTMQKQTPGKPLGSLAGTSRIIASVFGAKEMCPDLWARSLAQPLLEEAIKEWEATAKEERDKVVNAFFTMQEYKTKMGPVMLAIASWSFEAVKWWVNGQDEGISKKAENIIGQYANWQQLVETTSKFTSWVSSDTGKDMLKEIEESMASLSENIDRARLTAAQSVMANVVLKIAGGLDRTKASTMRERTLQYITGTLNVAITSLPDRLVSTFNELPGGPKEDTSTPIEAPAPASSSGSAAASSVALEAALEPRKNC